MTHPLEDLHVHSTWSDGRDTLDGNVATAERLGLERLGCVDHVRSDTRWAPSFAAAVDQLRDRTDIALICGVEAKLLDTAGHLDLPSDLRGVDRIYAADHQVPFSGGCAPPRVVRQAIARGEVDPRQVVDDILTATAAAVERYPNVVIAHLFSLLPKLRIRESSVDLDAVAALADTARRHGAWLEIDERWRAPSARIARVFADEGVRVVLSSDAHEADAIGRYTHNLEVAAHIGLRRAVGAA